MPAGKLYPSREGKKQDQGREYTATVFTHHALGLIPRPLPSSTTCAKWLFCLLYSGFCIYSLVSKLGFYYTTGLLEKSWLLASRFMYAVPTHCKKFQVWLQGLIILDITSNHTPLNRRVLSNKYFSNILEDGGHIIRSWKRSTASCSVRLLCCRMSLYVAKKKTTIYYFAIKLIYIPYTMIFCNCDE